MELRREGARRVRALTEFGSDATVAFLAHGAARVVRIEIAAGGDVGRHPAIADQLFVVVEGDGVVSGGDGTEVAVARGDVVLWAAGEEHETRSASGLVAIVVEAAGLEPG